MFNRKFDIIICKMLSSLRVPISGMQYKQSLIYKFLISVVPFVFEKVTNVEASYLMLSEPETELLIQSESLNLRLMLEHDSARYEEILEGLEEHPSFGPEGDQPSLDIIKNQTF